MSDNRQALVEVMPGEAGRVRQWFRGRGRPNNIKSLMRMRAMVRASLGLDGNTENAELSGIADNILREWGIRTGDEYAICDAVHTFIYNNVGYVQDRAGGYERLQWPLETLRRGLGDCDDLEILEASLLGLCGIQDIWFEAAKYFEDTEGEDHVYGFAKILSPNILDGILYHDATALIIEDKPLGWHETRTLETIQVPVFEDEHNTLISIGMGGLWSTLISIGGIAAAPFTGGLSIPIANTGAGLVGQKEASGAQNKEIGKTFEAIAKEVVDYFNSIQKQGRPITVEEYNTAANKLSALADFVDAYPISYVTGKWNSNDYKPVFEERLKQIKAVALASATGTSSETGKGNTTNGAGGTNTGAGASGGGDSNTANGNNTKDLIDEYAPLVIVGLLAAVALRG